jgi:hypothetical protein
MQLQAFVDGYWWYYAEEGTNVVTQMALCSCLFLCDQL